MGCPEVQAPHPQHRRPEGGAAGRRPGDPRRVRSDDVEGKPGIIQEAHNACQRSARSGVGLDTPSRGCKEVAPLGLLEGRPLLLAGNSGSQALATAGTLDQAVGRGVEEAPLEQPVIEQDAATRRHVHGSRPHRRDGDLEVAARRHRGRQAAVLRPQQVDGPCGMPEGLQRLSAQLDGDDWAGVGQAAGELLEALVAEARQVRPGLRRVGGARAELLEAWLHGENEGSAHLVGTAPEDAVVCFALPAVDADGKPAGTLRLGLR
mmetsp:Transcript_108845/g.336174  ORF Transcript_108845/g.336174 Transcript_108845/m.336174 type:complete len:263 (+) Transcript_108845:120-908(+)